MKPRDVSNQAVHAALDDCLSGVEALPSRRDSILRAAKGEQKVKRKIHLGLVLAIVLMMTMGSVALAAGLGLFGQLGQREDADTRLPALETVSTVMDKTFTTPEGVTVTIQQAYYDGTRVFISYVVEGPYDQITLGEGTPDIVNWDWEEPGETYGNLYGYGVAYRDKGVDESNDTRHQIADYLDGSTPRWAERTYVNVHDGLNIGDEYADIIGGNTYPTEDGKLVGWKECVVPPELAADEVTFTLGTFTSHVTYYQTEDALYTSFGDRAETTWHPFTVKKDASAGTKLSGSAKGVDWQATAELTASAIDVKGEVRVVCPESWHRIWETWENPDKIDTIQDWVLYVAGKPVEGYNLDGGIGGMGGDALVYGVCYRLDSLTEDLRLVPVYGYSGAHVEEGIVLTAGK